MVLKAYTFNPGCRGLAPEFRGLHWDTFIETCQEPCKAPVCTIEILLGPAADPPQKWQPSKSPGELGQRSARKQHSTCCFQNWREVDQTLCLIWSWEVQDELYWLSFFSMNYASMLRTSYFQLSQGSWKAFGEFIFQPQVCNVFGIFSDHLVLFNTV